MCIQIKTIFRCNCLHQNTLLCPHHIYVRETLGQIESEGKYADDGFQLRLESALQAHNDWTPLKHDDELVAAYPPPKWEHCSVYKARHQTDAGEVKIGKEKELTCPNWIPNQESFSKLVRGLCAECVDGHGVRTPSPVKGRFIEEIDLQIDDDTQASVTVNVFKNENEIRPSTPTCVRGISQQTPLRKILSQAKQKVIRHNMGTGVDGINGGGSRSSTPTPSTGDSAGGFEKRKGKELPDVFARLLLGTGSTTKGKGGGANPGSSTPIKRPVSRQTKGAGRGVK